MKFLLIIIPALAVTLPVAGQNVNLKSAYFGESFSHYGLKAGLEKSFSETQRNATSQFFYSASLALYRHAHNHVGVILTPEISWRRTGERGGFAEGGISASLFRYFYEGSTYEASGDGQFTKVPLAGRTAFLPGVAIGYGRDLQVSRDLPIAWYIRLVGMRQYPYNISSLTRVAIEIGIIKKLNNK